MTEKPIGVPVTQSLNRPKGAAHQAGKGSERSSRHAIRVMKPKLGYQPVWTMIGSPASNDSGFLEIWNKLLTSMFDVGLNAWANRAKRS